MPEAIPGARGAGFRIGLSRFGLPLRFTDIDDLPITSKRALVTLCALCALAVTDYSGTFNGRR